MGLVALRLLAPFAFNTQNNPEMAGDSNVLQAFLFTNYHHEHINERLCGGSSKASQGNAASLRRRISQQELSL